jgi:O-antigen ligase
MTPKQLRASALVHGTVLLFLSSAVPGALTASQRPSAVAGLLWFAGFGLLYLAVFFAARRPGTWRSMAFASCLPGAAVALYFLAEYRHLAPADKVPLATAVGQTLSGWSPDLAVWRPFSNSVATFLEGSFVLALSLIAARHGRRGGTLALCAASSLGLALFASASRGAWIAVATALAVWGVVSWTTDRPRLGGRRPGQLFVISATAAALVAIATALRAGLPWTDLFDRPDRLDVYGHSLSLIRDFPFTGVGLGDEFSRALSQHVLLIPVPFLGYSHSLVFDIWLELGLAGVLAATSLLGAAAWAAFAGERAGLGRGFRATWAGLLAVLVHGLTDARQFIDPWTFLPTFALLGLMAARLWRFNVPLSRPGFCAAAAMPLAVTLAVVAWINPIEAAWETNRGGLIELRAAAGAWPESARARQLQLAEQRYARAIAIDAQQPTARRRLGVLAMDRGRFDAAVGHLEIAWKVDPDNYATQKALGLARTWTGEIDRAASLLRHQPGMADELGTWAAWRESRGEIELAVRALQVAEILGPDPRIRRKIETLSEVDQTSPQAN